MGNIGPERRTIEVLPLTAPELPPVAAPPPEKPARPAPEPVPAK